MDGNGRWAEKRGLPRSEGHRAGSEAAKTILDACHDRGIRNLTLYTFSRENWSRPKDEVVFLFDLLQSFIKRELGKLVEKSVQLRVLGEMDELPFATRQALRHAINKTRGGQSMVLNLALNYSSRDEILRACRRMMTDGLGPEDVNEETFSERLYTAGQPDPDLIIRTSGELRLSNYLLFQAAYSELYFTDTLWPDFDEAELDNALADYASRQRRFGATGEQLGTKE